MYRNASRLQIFAFSGLISALIAACGVERPSAPRIIYMPTPGGAARQALSAQLAKPVREQPVPQAVLARRKQVQTALRAPLPVINQLTLEPDAQAAVGLALRDLGFVDSLRSPITREALRGEIFSSAATREADLVMPALAACRNSRCFKVELYNYATNATMTAFVDVARKNVLAVLMAADTQPEVPPHLAQLATEIAMNAPEVEQALGFKPADLPVMANVKTALNGSKCERSRHLCVAPTFVTGERALWAIVDLTDEDLVGTRWTHLSSSAHQPVTEKSLQDEVVTAQFCDRTTSISRNGWDVNYVLTLTDGLSANNVKFNGKSVIKSAKLVDWHVSYSQNEGFGYSDAVGCPLFSSAAVVAFNGPRVLDMTHNGEATGFALVQDFRSKGWPQPCHYSYQQRHEFYNDGRYRLTAVSLGRGCGNDGTYRPVSRIQFAEQSALEEWSEGAWKPIVQEGWRAQSATLNPQGYQFKLSLRGGGGFYAQMNNGQLVTGERGDNALVYVTRHHPQLDEGDTDLGTIGPCCNVDYRQGPQKFFEPVPEALEGDLVFWYVAQLKNDDRRGSEYCWADAVVRAGVYAPVVFPCASGAMFVPFGT